MSNIFASKKAAADTIEDDYIGGSGGALDTDVYEATIKACYMQKASASEAMSVVTLLKIDNREVRSQIWTTNRSGGVTYKDKKTGEEKNLPGYTQINALALLVTGKELGNLDVENKSLNLYDFDAKKELPTAVDHFSELQGQKIMVALQRQTVDKTAKDPTSGDYLTVFDEKGNAVTRDVNEVVKFFPEGKTVTISEVADYVKSLGTTLDEVIEGGNLLKAINKMPESMGVYAKTWLDKNKGETWDKSTKTKGEGKAFSGGSKAGANDAVSKAANDLFN